LHSKSILYKQFFALSLTSQQPKPGGASDPKQAEEKEMKKKRILTIDQVTPAQRLLAAR